VIPCVAMSNPLKAYRTAKKLSQGEIAEKLGVSRAMVGFLENGEREYSAEMAVLIEERLGLNRVLFRPDLFRRRAA
jgi:transcriptional regulator with XRE-family HTH domain